MLGRVELLGRRDEFFMEFVHLPKENLRGYCLRYHKERRKLREAGLEIHDLLAGWHLMRRAAILAWQEPSLRARGFAAGAVQQCAVGEKHGNGAKDHVWWE